jgi:hypothetical protein
MIILAVFLILFVIVAAMMITAPYGEETSAGFRRLDR